jgi:hypothetical protein
MRWIGHIAHTGAKRNTKNFGIEPEGKRPRSLHVDGTITEGILEKSDEKV